MDQILKTVKDYTNWKNNLQIVLDKNLSEVVNILIDAGALNIFLPIELSENNFFQPNFQNQHTNYNQVPVKIIQKGIVINQAPGSTTKLIWYFSGLNFYLINQEASTALNLQPFFTQPQGFQNIFIQGVHSARFEIKVEFLLAFIEWLPSLEETLKSRMQSIDPKQAEAKINAFSKAVS